MKYEHTIEGRFLDHPNRFIAHVGVQGEQMTARVKNTGCRRELLVPGVTALLQHHPGAPEAGQKTEYSLIRIYKGDILINMDSQAPNRVAEEWLRTGDFTRETGIAVSDTRREMTYGNPRFDLAFLVGEEQAYMEVKRITLEVNHAAKLPDTPMERGIKRVKGLALASKRGLRAYILFVIQMRGATSFMPNIDTHPTSGEVSQEASQAGVHIMAYDYIITKEELGIDQSIEVFIHKN